MNSSNKPSPRSVESAAKDWRSNRSRPYRRKAVIKLARLIDSIPVWLDRYQYPIAFLGLASGAASYWLIDRQPALAAGIAIAALVGWLLLVVEAFILSAVTTARWKKAGNGVFQITLQTIHQEALFFVLTFALLSTNWNSGQALFAIVIIGLTITTSIDPIYHLALARSRIALLSFHALTMFLCSFLALPIALQIPLDEALLLSLSFTACVTVPLLYVAHQGAKLTRLASAIAVVICLSGSLWLLRGFLPPMSTQIQNASITTQIDSDSKKALAPKQSYEAKELEEHGLYAFTPIKAPHGLNQGIEHIWEQNGVIRDRIPMTITGGRSEGYRAWSHKQNFPPNPNGDWQVTVKTPQGLVLGKISFEVY